MKKRILTVLLTVAMLATTISLCLIPVSANALSKTYEAAADGEVLYEILFGETSGVYQPTIFDAADDATKTGSTIAVSNGGKTVTLTKDTAAAARLWYGGAIEGLTMGADKKYTIEATVKTTGANSGIYFNFLNDGTATADIAHLFGYYGTPVSTSGTTTQGSLAYGGSKLDGLYYCDAVNYFPQIYDTDAEGFLKMSIEVDGGVYRVFFNGEFFDMAELSPTMLNSKYNNIGFTAYLYNKGVELIIKDAKVYKGNIYSSAPGFKITDEPRRPLPKTGDAKLNMDTYKAAKAGDKLCDLIFGRTTGDFTPYAIVDNGTVAKVTVADGGRTLNIVKGSTKGASWYGGEIGDLMIDETTQYTFRYRLKTNKGNSGVSFNFDEYTPARNRVFNVYGNFVDASSAQQIVIQFGSAKIAGKQLNTTAYTPIMPLLDSEGYADVVSTIDGYKWSVYYKGADGQYTLFEEYDCEPDRMLFGKQVGFDVYIYNSGAEFEVNNVMLYKGTIDDIPATDTPDETEAATVTEAPVTEAPTPDTKAPDTDAPVTDPDTKAPDITTKAPSTDAPATDAPKDDKKGCGSMAAAGAVMLVVTCAAAIVFKKKN